jgi:uncharacterized protein (TIGR03382 family)
VFGGDLTVGVDEKMRVFLVNSGNPPGMAMGSHKLGEAAAHKAALAGSFEGATSGSIVAGYRTFLGSTRAVYRVDFIAEKPAGDWRSFVDGETGAVLFRENLRSYASAPGMVYEISPVENLSGLCPIGASGGETECDAAISVTFPNLNDGTNLLGSQTSAYNCNGANQPTTVAGVPGNCVPVAAVSGAFNFTPDLTTFDLTDSFAGGMAYYHLDKHVTFFKTLDPNLPPSSTTATGGQSRALRGSLPGLVNNRNAGGPFENAFFSGGLDAMVFGQGAHADYSYDATVMYHEFTHGVVFAWGGYETTTDALGAFEEDGALNEGTADSMAVSETGHSAIGGFIGATSNPASPSLRDMSDPNATRSCHGDGSHVTQLVSQSINGFDGEVHDDGEIWNGFYWEVFDGLRTAGIKGCNGACEAGPPLQYKTIELAAGTGPTFANYWLTFKSAATALFPQQPSVAAYAGCVARRRGFDKCDRTVPLFAGELKNQFIRSRYSPFQIVLQVTAGTPTFQVCDSADLPTTIYARNGTPVGLTAIDQTTGNATIAADKTATFRNTCTSPAAFALPAGTWYLLLDSTEAEPGANPGQDVYSFGAFSSAGVTTGFAVRPAAATPITCGIKAVATTAPHGPLTLTSSLGAGVTWSIVGNHSGGSIVAATGVYTAGLTPSVVDSIQATDAAGDFAFQDVNVGPGVSVTPGTAAVQAGAQQAFTATGGSGSFTWTVSTNASGATVDATGKYTAGATGGTDVVTATDTDGNSATASVTVTATPATGTGGTGSGSGSGGGKSGGCSTTGAGNAMLLAAAGLVLVLRRRRK